MIALGAFLLVCTTSVGAGNDAVLVYFSTNNCTACRTADPVVRQLEEYGAVVRRVDAEREPELAERFSIRAFPTFVVMRGGREVNRFVGVQDIRDLHTALTTEQPNRLANTAAAASIPAPSMVQPAGTTGRNAPAIGGNQAMVPLNAATSQLAKLKDETPDLASAVLRAQRATVRIRVYEGKGFGVGTGTIIDTHGEEALIMTCGHIFRDTNGQGRIEVDLFVGGRTVTVPGRVIDFDAKTRDIGLLSVRPGVPVVPVPIASASNMPTTGQSVFSYGCDYGADPSRRDTRISAINKFQGPQNVEIAGAPVEGRSGGGLFDQNGHLIGVCNAADRQDDEGLYAGPQVMHWQLDRVELTHLYQNSKVAAVPSAENNTRLVSESMPPQITPTAPAISGQANNAGAAGVMNNALQASGDEEVICIVRSRRDPAAAPRVLTIAAPTPELMQAIGSAAR